MNVTRVENAIGSSGFFSSPKKRNKSRFVDSFVKESAKRARDFKIVRTCHAYKHDELSANKFFYHRYCIRATGLCCVILHYLSLGDP